MKRVISDSHIISATPVKRIVIEVKYSLLVSASDILPLQNEDGTYNEAALAEYEEFVVNALEVFDRNDFEVIEEAESDRSKSMYFTLVKKGDQVVHDYKYILFIRISDHLLSDRSKLGRMHYYADKAQDLKQPQSKKKQVWRLKDVIVNGHVFDSYEAALIDLDNRLR